MTQQDVLNAANDFSNNIVHFQNGANVFAVLIGSTWYPLVPLINHAATIAGDEPEHNTSEACKAAAQLFPYVNIKRISIENNQLPELSNAEKLDEINALSRLITTLSI